jgi:hypothetical protein
MAPNERNLRVTGSVVLAGLAGAATGTITLGPGVNGNPSYNWHVTGLIAQTSRPGLAPIPRLQVYKNQALAAFALGLTYDGSFTSASADDVVSRGESLVFVWANGNPGDVATVVLTGALR